MRLLHDVRTRREMRSGLPTRSIRSDEHAQAVRVRGQCRLVAGKEEDLLGPGLPYAGKGPEGPLRLAGGRTQGGAEITAK
jgi:hypothetical protein